MVSRERLTEFLNWLDGVLANWTHGDFHRWISGRASVSWRDRADAAGFDDIPDEELPRDFSSSQATMKFGQLTVNIGTQRDIEQAKRLATALFDGVFDEPEK